MAIIPTALSVDDAMTTGILTAVRQKKSDRRRDDD
jgi:L-cystine uptake protein TcyP (sodium:dicarboxylate symporter family)